MHSAPSVSFPVERSRFAGGVAALLWLCSAAAVLHLCLTAPVPGWRELIVGATLLATGAVAVRAWLFLPAGQLCWDGHRWQWSSAGVERAGTLSVLLDLQQRMLVRWRCEDGTALHLWLERATLPERWHRLRCATYARAAADHSIAAGTVEATQT